MRLAGHVEQEFKKSQKVEGNVIWMIWGTGHR
jgi:hypothetical protein